MNYNEPWRTVGFDLDGVLAYTYWPGEGPYDCYKIGDPIPSMVDLCKQHIANGDNVVIFTARVAPNGSYINAEHEDLERIHQVIGDWTELHIGKRLEATAIKDHRMSVFYDDRCMQVLCNTGRVLMDDYEKLFHAYACTTRELEDSLESYDMLERISNRRNTT